MPTYYAIMTNNGLAKVAAAQSGGTQFSITHFAVGDANGAYYEPADTATALVAEKWRATVNRVYVHPNNANWIVIEALIPATAGGFDIREAAAFASDGQMVAIGKYPLTNKPAPGSGSEKDLYVRMILQVSNTATVSQTIDNSLVMATQAYVDQRVPHVVRVATTGNVALSGLTAQDGVTLAADDRVLVCAQTTQSQNGIYLAKSTAWVRSTDFDNSLESTDGVMVIVAEGTVNADSVWLLSTNAPITLGTTALTFTKILPDETPRAIVDTAAPTGDTAAPKTLFGWLAYMIKSVTGKGSWRTAPATTLEAANTHHGRTDNPHGTTAAQVGASAAGHNHAGTYEPANANIQAHISATAPHTGHVSHSLATAVNDFLVASAAGAFVKKTVAEVRTILGLGGAAYLNTGSTNGTVAPGDHGHGNNANIGGPYSSAGHGHSNDGNIGGPYALSGHSHDATYIRKDADRQTLDYKIATTTALINPGATLILVTASSSDPIAVWNTIYVPPLHKVYLRKVKMSLDPAFELRIKVATTVVHTAQANGFGVDINQAVDLLIYTSAINDDISLVLGIEARNTTGSAKAVSAYTRWVLEVEVVP